MVMGSLSPVAIKAICTPPIMPIRSQAQILRAATCVAGADGHVDASERRVLKKLGDRIGVGERTLNALIEQAHSDPRFYETQLEALTEDPKAAMKILFTVACADGVLLEEEIQSLQRIADRIGLDDKQFARIQAGAERLLRTGKDEA